MNADGGGSEDLRGLEQFMGRGAAAQKAVDRVLEKEVTPPASTTSWCIWAPEHNGWWGPNRHGYTAHVGYAGIYSREDAIQIWIESRYQDTPVPYGAALELMRALEEYAIGGKR